MQMSLSKTILFCELNASLICVYHRNLFFSNFENRRQLNTRVKYKQVDFATNLFSLRICCSVEKEIDRLYCDLSGALGSTLPPPFHCSMVVQAEVKKYT